MAWPQDFSEHIEIGMTCPVCVEKYGRKNEILKVDYLGYSWRCYQATHTSLSWRKNAYDRNGYLKISYKKKETENEFGPVTP